MQSNLVSDKRSGHAVCTKTLHHLAVWFVGAAVLSIRWLGDFNVSFVLTLGAVYAVLMVLIGRWLFGRKAL